MASSSIQAVPDSERRSSWLSDRREIITATDAAKILGKSPWGTAIDVYAEKVGIGEEKPATKDQLRGKRRERLVLDTYADEEGISLLYGDPFKVLRHPSLPIGCTLDATRADDGRPVEAKTARWKDSIIRLGNGQFVNGWGQHGTDEIPVFYATQMAIQVAVVNADRAASGLPLIESADLPAEFTGQDYECFRLHRDAQTEADLLELLLDFKRRYIDKRIPPPVDGSEGYANFLKAAWPRHTERVVVLADEMAAAEAIEDATEREARKEAVLEIIGAARMLDELRKDIKVKEFQKSGEESTIKRFMADAGLIEGHGWQATWRTNKAGSKTDWESVAQEVVATWVEHHGELEADFAKLVAKHTKPTKPAKPFVFTTEDEK